MLSNLIGPDLDNIGKLSKDKMLMKKTNQNIK